jgi:hypothetical protein
MPSKKGGLAEVRAHPLSDGDIRKVLGPIRIMTNRDLNGHKHIDEILDRQGRLMLLYTPEDPNSGHWVCLWKTSDGSVNFFDSYGERPDLPEDLGPEPPVLTDILKQSQMPVFYNTHQYQHPGGDVATCGRWCIARLLYRDRTPEQFHAIVKSFKGEGDDLVSALIYMFIKK